MKRATKILTLVTLATAPAAADTKVPEHWSSEPGTNEAVVMLQFRPYVVRQDAKPELLSWEEYGRYLGETGPLTGSDGRPGCGNVYGKSPGPSACNVARTKALEARQVAYKAMEVETRANAKLREDCVAQAPKNLEMQGRKDFVAKCVADAKAHAKKGS